MTKSARFSIIIGGVGLLILLLVGVVAAFTLLSSSQDVRNQASVKNGVVTVQLRTMPQLATTTTTAVGQPVELNLLVNTSGAAIDALQLRGTVSGVDVDNLAFVPTPGLQDLTLSLNRITDNRVELIFTLANPDQPFVRATDVAIGKLVMVPTQAGQLQIQWDSTNSKATLYKRAVDSLKAITATTITVTGGENRPTPTPSTGPVSDIQRACESSGGVWRQFGNSCGDSCGVGPEVMCAQVLTYGCDCGANACWNGQTCGPATSVSPRPSSPTRPTPDPYECVPRPTCLDAVLPCRMAEPAVGWCPKPTGDPRPTNRPTPSPSPSTTTGCVRAGCSGQLCVPASQGGLTTTCEFRPEYACYQQATCEMQANGRCGFTDTTELRQCLENGGTRPGTPTPSPSTPPTVNLDLNGDGRVNLADLTLFIQYLRDANAQADMNQDGRVNILDYSLFIQQLGNTSANRTAQ